MSLIMLQEWIYQWHDFTGVLLNNEVLVYNYTNKSFMFSTSIYIGMETSWMVSVLLLINIYRLFNLEMVVDRQSIK